jgi:protein TonB
VTHTSSTPDEVDEVVVADPQDRFLAPPDPLLRNDRRRFIAAVIIVCLIHAALLVALILLGHAQPQTPVAEIPVEVVVVPPPPKPEPKKEEPKPQPQPQPKPKKEKPHYEKPATDTPPAANKEEIEREEPNQKSASPLHGNPQPEAQKKPVPTQPKPAQNAASTPAKQTTAPATPEDKPDAETISKAAPVKDGKPAQKEKPAKTSAPETSRERASLEREFAALSQSPHFSIASRAKASPVSGGHCHTNPYLCTLYGLIMRQEHYPESAKARGLKGKVIVAFWLDERGDLVHQALYRTSGYPELDRAAVAAIEKAAPFPPPPPGQPHGFVAQMAFPPD